MLPACFSSFSTFRVSFFASSSSSLQLVLLQHRRPPCPKDTKPPAPKPRAAKPAKTKKSRHIVKTRLAPEFVHFFKQNDTFSVAPVSSQKDGPIKNGVFLDISLCVAPPQKHVRRTRVCHRGVWRARISIRGFKLHHKTRVQMAVATCVSGQGTQAKTSWPTVTVGAKRLNKCKRRLVNLR